MRFFKSIQKSDVFFFMGLPMLGIGLFFWFGLGVSLTSIGALLVCIGFFAGAVKVKT